MELRPILLLTAILLFSLQLPTSEAQATFSWLHGIVAAVSGNKKSIVDTLFGLYDNYATETQTGEFFRIEGHFMKLINDGAILADGSSCDTIGNCDPDISAYVDL